MSLEGAEIPIIKLMGFDFSSVGSNNTVSDTLAELVDLVRSLVFSLDALVFGVFALLSLLFVLFIKAERMSVVSSSSLGSL